MTEKKQKESSITHNAIKTTADIIVWLPLTIIILSVLVTIGYGVYKLKTDGVWPPQYQSAGRLFISIMKQILTALQIPLYFLWWLLPITPGLRTRFNNWMFPGPLGSPPVVGDPRLILPFGSLNNGQPYTGPASRANQGPKNLWKTLGILFVSLLIAASYLIFRYPPGWMLGYSRIINFMLMFGLMAGVIGLFILFNKDIMSGTSRFGIGTPFPDGNQPNSQFNWLFKNVSRYLFTTISVGLLLAFLCFLMYLFVFSSGIASVTGTTFLMVVLGAVLLGLTYFKLKTNPNFMRFIDGSKAISGLFYAFFIIPCIFFEITRFLYNQFRHTPKSAYIILGIEIALISLYFVIPKIINWFYTFTPGKENKDIIIQNKINSAKKDKIVIEERINQILSYKSDGKGSELTKSQWKTIISKYYNSKDKEEDLRSWLADYGYITKEMCKEKQKMNSGEGDTKDCEKRMNNMVDFIQSNTSELVSLKSKKKNIKIYIKDLENQKRNLKQFNKGKVLLREPVYLNNKKHIGGFQDFNVDKIDLEYNYNYSISSWFFIRANPPNFKKSYSKYSVILNYGNKPKIMYNPMLNKIKVIMNNGLNKKHIEYIIDGPGLQKWNNIVINYDGGHLDIFMNSKLLRSFPSVLPYMSYDQLTVGENEGLGGGICNVVYFPVSISRERIIANYNLLKNNNPPII